MNLEVVCGSANWMLCLLSEGCWFKSNGQQSDFPFGPLSGALDPQSLQGLSDPVSQLYVTLDKSKQIVLSARLN